MRLLLALLVPFLLLLAGCGGDEQAASGGASGDGLDGVAVQGGTDSKPQVEIDDGYSVSSTQAETLVEGDGDKVGAQDVVTVDYVGINARNGEEFDSSWASGQPATFSLGPGMISGFNKALVGQTVGSRVVAAIPPKDGYGSQGNPQAGIQGNDTLVFVIDIRDASSSQAQGQAVQPPTSLPHLATNKQGQPTEFHQTAQTAPAPKRSAVHTVIKGEGEPIESGQTVTLNYLGQVYPDGQIFDSSFGRASASFPIGQGQPLPCFDELVGQSVGSRAILVCPADEGFGPQGNPQAGIKGDDTLIFAVDLLRAE
ncbi:MAG TPA: FKBP-type peptidyl-prolyl cis-trans isomerase [Nocardioidaceae bacterium]|nr:FKBP-type peptidyl-prolyl cis-trans isomerase [Nocardioidaceae bacterium]